ncbi:hypothetical protein [Sphaerisporangium dianthi]|uniref:Uncharacterized protein n=1 Tax=Sphaerisporangium dianthi TaxID=1436120 RepID=A0ABV9CLR6_9ACTN
MSALRRAGLAVSGAVLAITLGTQAATASIVTYNLGFWSQVCAGGISARDIRDFRSLLQADNWQPAHQYAGYPDSALKLMLQRGCTAFDRYRTAEAANRAVWG